MRSKKHCTLIVVLILVSSFAFSQDFIVPGCIYDNDNPVPVYWGKSGINFLPVGTWQHAVATSFVHREGHLVVIGYTVEGKISRPVAWFDGQIVELKYPVEFDSIRLNVVTQVSGKLVIVGNASSADGLVPIIWRDGEYQVLRSDKYHDLGILDAVEYGGKLLLVGSYKKNEKLFKFVSLDGNDSFLNLTGTEGLVSRCVTNGTDVYFGGSTQTEIGIWKNGNLFSSAKTTNGIVYDIAFFHGKLYSCSAVRERNASIRLYNGIDSDLLNTAFPTIDRPTPAGMELLGIRDGKPISLLVSIDESSHSLYRILVGNGVVVLH
jgi:hypothetical protein